MSEQKKWSTGELEEHISTNVEDYGAAIVVGALYKKLYGHYPKIGLSGYQAGAIDALQKVLPEGECKTVEGAQ